MNTITFTCSEHGHQPVVQVSTGRIKLVPVRVSLACGCSFVWLKNGWRQQVSSTGFQELAREDHVPG